LTLSVYWSERGVPDGTSPSVSYGWKGQGSGSRQIAVRWQDRLLAQQQAVGFSYAQTSGGVRRLRRELPEPLTPFDATYFCTKAGLVRGVKWTGRAAYDRATGQLLPGYPKKDPTKDPDGSNDLDPRDSLWKVNEFARAVLNLDFAQADFSIASDATIDTTYGGSEFYRFVTYRDDRCASYVTVRGGVLYYIIPGVGADEPAKAQRVIPFAVGKVEGRKTLYLKWHQVSADAVPWQTIDGLIGKTNKTQFYTSAYPAGTLLFLPPKVDRYVMANGQVGLDLEFVMDYFAAGQHKLLRAERGTIIDYRYATIDPNITAEPAPGSIPAGKFLFDEAEFLDAWDCSKP
jgi:hypothetical protein